MRTKTEILEQWYSAEREMATNESMPVNDFYRLYGWKEALEWVLEGAECQK